MKLHYLSSVERRLRTVVTIESLLVELLEMPCFHRPSYEKYFCSYNLKSLANLLIFSQIYPIIRISVGFSKAITGASYTF